MGLRCMSTPVARVFAIFGAAVRLLYLDPLPGLSDVNRIFNYIVKIRSRSSKQIECKNYTEPAFFSSFRSFDIAERTGSSFDQKPGHP